MAWQAILGSCAATLFGTRVRDPCPSPPHGFGSTMNADRLLHALTSINNTCWTADGILASFLGKHSPCLITVTPFDCCLLTAVLVVKNAR